MPRGSTQLSAPERVQATLQLLHSAQCFDTFIHSSATTASFSATSRYLPTLSVGSTLTHELVQAPIQPLHFAQLLETHPSPQFVNTLLMQLQYGFVIGYQGPHQNLRALNLPSATEHPQVIDDYLALECSQGRMAGPFPNPPYQPFHCSGMGVVLKQDGSYRVIIHLSAPPGRSINDGIDPEAITLAYTSVDEAIRLANALGRDTLFAKIYLKSAFRQYPVRAADWHLLGLYWRGQYYYDKCLPFGLRSSPFLFNTVAVALEYIIRMHLGNPRVIHYLDDFLFAGPPDSDECEHTLNGAELLCNHLEIETKRAKRTLPTTCISFLGVELDTAAQIAPAQRCPFFTTTCGCPHEQGRILTGG